MTLSFAPKRPWGLTHIMVIIRTAYMTIRHSDANRKPSVRRLMTKAPAIGPNKVPEPPTTHMESTLYISRLEKRIITRLRKDLEKAG